MSKYSIGTHNTKLIFSDKGLVGEAKTKCDAEEIVAELNCIDSQIKALAKPKKAKKKDFYRWRKNKGKCPNFKHLDTHKVEVMSPFGMVSSHNKDPSDYRWSLNDPRVSNVGNITHWRYVK